MAAHFCNKNRRRFGIQKREIFSRWDYHMVLIFEDSTAILYEGTNSAYSEAFSQFRTPPASPRLPPCEHDQRAPRASHGTGDSA